MNNDPMAYLHRTGLTGAVNKPKVHQRAIAVKRDAEFPERTKSGPREGHPAGRIKTTAKPGQSYTAEADLKGTRDGDGWPGKGNPNKPARVGPETGPSQGFETKGSNKAKAAGKSGVEQQSANVDPPNTAVRKTTKTANINGNDSKKYDALEKKTTRSMKEGGSEKELRRGHNLTTKVPIGGSGGGYAKPPLNPSRPINLGGGGSTPAAGGPKLPPPDPGPTMIPGKKVQSGATSKPKWQGESGGGFGTLGSGLKKRGGFKSGGGYKTPGSRMIPGKKMY